MALVLCVVSFNFQVTVRLNKMPLFIFDIDKFQLSGSGDAVALKVNDIQIECSGTF